ncbi:MAG: YgiT-type zinc finger protein [Lentisphaerae bacterium]|nr:YgiT-type zinc finger protein [Lentisphaerota bacterium]
MKCSIQGCPGTYEQRLIVHTVKKGADVLVFENVPSEVCDVCSDMLFAPETIRHLEQLMSRRTKPERQAPVYEYA